MKALAPLFVGCLALTACSDSNTSTTAPTQTQSNTLSGTVTASVTNSPIENAVVDILDGQRAGANTRTNAQGSYQFTDLTGNVNLRADHECFVEQRQGAAMTTSVTVNFQLDANPVSSPEQIAPADGSVFRHFPRTTTLTWTDVACAASYTVEVDCYHCCQRNRWCSDVGRTFQLFEDIESTSHTFGFVGAQPGRWRVSAVDASGGVSAQTGWWVFRYTR